MLGVVVITEAREKIIARRGYRADIHGDSYSLYISSYPVAVKYLATRLKGDTLLELCCALGITLEGLSDNFRRMIGVDIDPLVLEDCRKNLKDCALLNKVELVKGNVTDENLLSSFKADVVIYDIPFWYSENLDKNPNLGVMMETIRKHITKNIVIFAPPFMVYEYFVKLLGECEYEQIYINGRYDRNYVYFGNLIRRSGITIKKLSR